MTIRHYASAIFLSWDFLVSIALTIAAALVARLPLPIALVKDMAGIALTLGALVFAVYFAALAIVATAGDDRFVSFAAKEGEYFEILATFGATLLVISISLVASILLYVSVLYRSFFMPETFLSSLYTPALVFLVMYPILAAINAALDAARWARSRARYLQYSSHNNVSSTDK